MLQFRTRHAALVASILSLALGAHAVPTSVTSVDTPTCDPLVVPQQVDELGNPPLFPSDELIDSFSYLIGGETCYSLPDDQLLPNRAVGITNLTAIAFTDLWYVADPETTLTNPDGLVNGMLAFKIDGLGANVPLLVESISFDGIFSPGETWEFVIMDYFNTLGLPPEALGSIGVPSPGAPPPLSSGSIIGLPVPEPGSAILLGLGLAALGARRRAQAPRIPGASCPLATTYSA